MLTDFQKNFLLTHYEADGCKFCCDTLNLQYKKIVYEAKKLNLFVNRTLLNKRISETKLKQSKNRTYSQYSVDPTNFISIKNKEISYILGLLWADGSIQEKTKKIQIEITTTDANEIIGLFKQTGNWCFYVRQRTDYKTQTTISTTNQILYSFLFNHGYKEKSIISPCSILNQIPNNLKHHFYRGILDGDGNIYQNPKTKGFVQVTISGSYIQDWKYMINLCDELLIK